MVIKQNYDKQLQTLVSYLESIDINVKSDKGNFKGGIIRYRLDKYLYLNRKLDTEARIKLIINEIKDLKLDQSEIEEGVLEILIQHAEV